MNKKSIVVLILGTFFAASVLLGGCSPSKKMVPSPTPQSQKNIVPKTTTVKTNANVRAAKVARACDSVPGVKKSTVVLSGNTAYIGLDLAANLEKSKTNSTEKACEKKAKAADSKIKTVYVSSDADTVTRLKKVYQGVLSGKPISSFTRELGEIARRITPKKG